MFSCFQIVPQPTVTLLRTFDPCHLSEYGTLGQDYGAAPGNQGGDSDRHSDSENSDSDGEEQLGEVAANRLYETLEPPDLGDLGGAAGEEERTLSGAAGHAGSDSGHGGKRPPAPRPRKNLPSAVKKINFGGPPKPPRNFNYALLGLDGDEADSEVCEKPKKAKGDFLGDAIKGKNGSKSKMKLQLEELGRLRVRSKRKDERKDSLKGEEEEDPSSRLAVENLYVTLPLPPSNESSPKKRSVSQK